MLNNTYEKIYCSSINLPIFQQKILVKNLLHNIVKLDHDNISNDFVSQITCPYCKSTFKVKNGKLKNRQRYLCKNCNKSYNIFTKTPISYSKKDVSLWEDYILMLLSCQPLRTTATKLSISLSTAFYWRHKLLDSLRENENTIQKLTESVKIFEHYTRESFKGGAIPPTRSAYKTGEAKRFKFTTNNSVCILIANDKKNVPIIEMACLNKPNDDTLENIFHSNIEPGSAIITDKWDHYKRFAAKNNLIYAPCLKKFTKSRLYHGKEVLKISSNLSKFLAKFQGVATKYLENYLCLFKRIYYVTSRLDFSLHTQEKIRIRDYKFREACYK